PSVLVLPTNRVPVRSLLDHIIERDRGSTAGAVLDHHCAERTLDPVGPQSTEHIVHAARRGRYDQVDLSGRKCWLRERGKVRQGAHERRRRSPREKISPPHCHFTNSSVNRPS